MAVNLQAILDAPIIGLDSIDSTNNYAMRLIDADTAQPGLTITTAVQTHGKGQRGNIWKDAPSQSLLMSIVITPQHLLSSQFAYNAGVATAIAGVLQNLCENADVSIKWPNDIIINAKKAGGVLIENVLRGSDWMYSVVGIGLNINQKEFTADLPNATSLYLEMDKEFAVQELAQTLRTAILQQVYGLQTAEEAMKDYNDFLFRRQEPQAFTDGKTEWVVTVLRALPNGQLEVQLEDGTITTYAHGTVTWKW